MRNRWVTDWDGVAAWNAFLPAAADRAERLRDWLERVAAAGEEQQVFVVHSARSIDYERSLDGPLAPYLRRYCEEQGVVDLFHFAEGPLSRVSDSRPRITTRLAYADESGDVVEEDVDDLKPLMLRLRPGVEDIGAGLTNSAPPLGIAGPRVDHRHPERSEGLPPSKGTATVRFTLYSDIWFPVVHDFLDEEVRGPDHLYDNRPLASRHTPRLNAFLAVARDATYAAGGDWELDVDARGLGSGPMLGEAGVDMAFARDEWTP